MDAPSRSAGAAHRIYRHDPINTPIEACRIYGETVDGAVLIPSDINDIITFIVTQHLVLDGLLPPTDPIYSLAFRIKVLGATDPYSPNVIPARLKVVGATNQLSHNVATHIKNTIQGLENKLKTLEQEMILCVLAFLFLLGVLFILFNTYSPIAFVLTFLFLILIMVPIGFIISIIDSYTSCKNAYQKLKEQEKYGEVKCPVCEKKTAVLVKKQGSTFIVCKRCGFAWFYKSLLLLPHNDAVRILSGEFRVEDWKVHEKCPRTGEMKNKPDECGECEYLMYKAVMDKAGCEWTLWKCTFEKKEGE